MKTTTWIKQIVWNCYSVLVVYFGHKYCLPIAAAWCGQECLLSDLLFQMNGIKFRLCLFHKNMKYKVWVHCNIFICSQRTDWGQSVICCLGPGTGCDITRGLTVAHSSLCFTYLQRVCLCLLLKHRIVHWVYALSVFHALLKLLMCKTISPWGKNDLFSSIFNCLKKCQKLC